ITGLIRQLKLESVITLTGFVSETDKFDLLRASKLFVSPSRREGFGINVLEAMSLGLPCILSDIPSFRENFHDVAELIALDDHVQLANSVIALLSDEERYRRMSLNGIKLAHELSWQTIAQKESDDIHELVTYTNRYNKRYGSK
ncbi:MAG: glycosyltransferase, partial [Nitrososphaerales archaeon]